MSGARRWGCGGLDISGTLVVDRYDGARTVQFELAELPAEKARRTLLELEQQPLGMIRQLEHRVSTLPELQARLDDERQTALREAQRARDTLAAPFKHADALQAAGSAVKRIKAAMQQHQHPPQDPQTLYWHRRLTTIVDAARCLPAERGEFGHESDSDLRQLADEALTGARAAYSTPRAGSAHHAAHHAPPQSTQAWAGAPRDRAHIER